MGSARVLFGPHGSCNSISTPKPRCLLSAEDRRLGRNIAAGLRRRYCFATAYL